jgi:hypothetical protein
MADYSSIIIFGEQYVKYTYSSINRDNILKYIIKLNPYVINKDKITKEYNKACKKNNIINHDNYYDFHNLNIFVLCNGLINAIIINNINVIPEIYNIIMNKRDDLSRAYLSVMYQVILITACSESNVETISWILDNLNHDYDLDYQQAFISSGQNKNPVQKFLLSLNKITINQETIDDYINICYKFKNISNLNTIIYLYPELIIDTHIILVISISSKLNDINITNMILNDYRDRITEYNINIIFHKLLLSDNLSGLKLLLENHDTCNINSMCADFMYALKIQIINNNLDIITFLDENIKLYIDTDCLITALYIPDYKMFELLYNINKKNNLVKINFKMILDVYIECGGDINKIRYLLENHDINLTPNNFIDSSYTGNLELVKNIHDIISDILTPEHYYLAAEQAAYSNNPDILIYLLSITEINLYLDLDKILRKSCQNGCIKTVKVLLNYYTDRQIYSNKLIILRICQSDNVDLFKYFIEKYPEIEIDYLKLLYASFIEDNSVFDYLLNNYEIKNCIYVLNSCINNNSDEYFMKILKRYPNIDITFNNHRAFKNACKLDNIYIAEILASMNPDYVLNILDDRIESWYIRDKYIKSLELLEKDDKNYDKVLSNLTIPSIYLNRVYELECPVCYEKNNIIKTNCNHHICLYCILKNYKLTNNFDCCLCRSSIQLHFSFSVQK